jgi:hypothetical protein
VARETRTATVKRAPITAAILASAALLAILLLLAAAPSAQADTMGFDAQPQPGSPNADLGFFKFDADPGASVQRVLVLTNRSDEAKVIRIAGCDGLAAVFGGVAYSESGKKPQAVGSWIDLSSTSVEVPAGSSVEVPFAVNVPSDVTTGVHLGGVALWEPAAATTSGTGEGGEDAATTKITMVTRMVLTVFVTTPGPAVPSLTISGVKAEARPDGMYLLVAIANDGTAPTKGEGTLSIPGESFQEPIALGDMVPASSTGYPVKWKTDPAEGTYDAEVAIRYEDGAEVAHWKGSFIVGQAEANDLVDRLVTPDTPGDSRPWLMYGLIGGLVLVVLVMGFALVRMRRHA